MEPLCVLWIDQRDIPPHRLYIVLYDKCVVHRRNRVVTEFTTQDVLGTVLRVHGSTPK